MQVAGVVEVIDNLESLFYLTLVMEVHFQMYTVATDVVEQRAQLVQCHPAGHDALTASQYLLV